ncbi:hypothetical protein E1262_28065 [Jiangella aurantiaca]|uniref:Uncharacterized protein n=1 Tax=Jiangella aurantiaca TaxID=2530373 RepID=A0A4R5A1L5_9ACTN|nr:hypothetical protein [Jiangella aurantiaca]TDD64504.1 hypothetical protein E1262_28065 [Jiangella aurantiaca]
MPTVFFGYASKPELARETLHNASRLITATGVVTATTWEDLNVGGRIIIDRILEQIDQADVAAFDVSMANQNVLFELGYAITRGKHIWLLLEEIDREARQRWRQFRLLSAVGYSGWSNSDDIRGAFLRESPHNSNSSLYDDLIEPSLTPEVEGSLFYLPSFHATEASKKLGRRLDQESRRGIRLLSADPTESALNPLAWYAQKVYETAGTIAHFVADRRDLAWLYNGRAALVAGMAAGFERPLLMVAEEDYSPPVDYMERLAVYDSAGQCQDYADQWLEGLDLTPRKVTAGRRVKLATELRGLRFGEHVAENEADLLSDYFVETAAFDEVISSRNALFVGRKGTGKTANMLQAAARLRGDARNLVVVIKPQSYEMEALVALLGRLPTNVTSYAVMSLWSFLLQSEIARSATLAITNRSAGVPRTEDENELVSFVEAASFGIMEEFAVRFERTVSSIAESGVLDVGSIGEGRDALNEALHSEAIRVLRRLVGPVLKGRERVAILVDNLDKAWDKKTDLDAAAQLLLGLLSAVGRVSVEYGKEDFWRDRIELSLAIFLRSDIYAHLHRAAREPDKIPTTVVDWRDPDLLFRVIEERFLAMRPTTSGADELWGRFFCATIRGRPLRDYLAWRVLPRPRDLVYICNAATISAVNARRDRVEEQDFIAAELNYSQFALEALLVENGITVAELEDVLLEFASGPAVAPKSDVLAQIRSVVKDQGRAESVLARLEAVSFLGLSLGDSRHTFPEVGAERKRDEVIARKFAEKRGLDVELVVHPAYRPYLEIEDPMEP